MTLFSFLFRALFCVSCVSVCARTHNKNIEQSKRTKSMKKNNCLILGILCVSILCWCCCCFWAFVCSTRTIVYRFYIFAVVYHYYHYQNAFINSFMINLRSIWNVGKRLFMLMSEWKSTAHTHQPTNQPTNTQMKCQFIYFTCSIK